VISFEYEMRYLQAGVSALEEYLLSDEVYWQIGIRAGSGEPPYPNLDLGNLLLSRARAVALSQHTGHDLRLVELDGRLEAVRVRWRVAWERKAARCFAARLNLWRDYLEDYRKDARDNLDRYAYEVRHRVMLHLLQAESGLIRPAEGQLLHALDGLLEAVFIPGAFVWQKDLATGFPSEPYWYLWGKPRSES
jgi:hypothetical protein